MRRTLSAIFVASSVAIAAAQGQQPAPSTQQPAATQGQPPAPETPRQQPDTAQLTKTTISGCVQNAPPTAAGGASAPTPAKFELASAKIVTPAPVGTGGTATTAIRYQLEGDEKLLTPHLNHQVEVTGTLSPASGTGATVAPMLKVESVKMVAAMCPKGPAE